MAQCPNCGRETRHEFCEHCGEYAGGASTRTGALPPAAVEPGPEQPRPPVRRIEEKPAAHGDDDLQCAACELYSPQDRTLCAHCGAPLVPPPLPEPDTRPWWRRLPAELLDRLRRLRRPAVRIAPVGPRPPAADRTVARRVGAVVGVVALLALLVAVVPPLAGATYRALTLRYEPVRGSAVRGASTRWHRPSRVLDGVRNTSWIAPTPKRAAVRIDFATPVDIDLVGITQGVGERPEAYPQYGRVARVALAFDDGTTATGELVDAPTFQTFEVRARDVRWVRITVVASYPASVKSHGIALAEIEFFRLA